MPTTDRLPADALRSVADQLAAFLPPPPARLPVSTATAAVIPGLPGEIGESLAVCPVTLQQVRRPPADLSVLARPSGYWHHQLRTDGVPTHTALTVKSGFGIGHEVQQVFATPLAGKIDAAIAWMDRNVTGRGTVRLLVAPAYLTHALLVVRTDDTLTAVLADQPAAYTKLQPEREYSLADFLKLLAKESPAGSLE